LSPARACHHGLVRIALLANPGSGRSDTSGEVLAALRRHGATVEAFPVDEPDRATEWGPDRIVVASGDGTVAKVAAIAAEAGVPLAVVPSGTANDFARSMGIPRDLDAAARIAATGRRTRRVDLGHTTARPFLNAAAAGLSVPALRRASGLKPLLGPLGYPAGAILAALRARPLQLTVSCDGRELFAGPAWQAIVANTGAFGGGSDAGPANPADGLLDVIVIAAGPRWRLALHGLDLRRGRIAVRPGVRRARAERVELVRGGEGLLNVDGDLVRGAGPPITVQARVVEVVVA
jgi:diacylglycerol kinase family enzyme